MSLRIDRDKGYRGTRDCDMILRFIPLGLDLDKHGHAFGTQSAGAGIEADDIAKVDRSLEINPIERCGDPSVDSVAAGLDESGLVDKAEDHAAEDRAVLVGIAGHGDDLESQAPVLIFCVCFVLI